MGRSLPSRAGIVQCLLGGEYPSTIRPSFLNNFRAIYVRVVCSSNSCRNRRRDGERDEDKRNERDGNSRAAERVGNSGGQATTGTVAHNCH